MNSISSAMDPKTKKHNDAFPLRPSVLLFDTHTNKHSSLNTSELQITSAKTVCHLPIVQGWIPVLETVNQWPE